MVILWQETGYPYSMRGPLGRRCSGGVLSCPLCTLLCFLLLSFALLVIVFLKHMHKDQVAVFTLGISICNLVLQCIKVCMWLNPFVFHYLGLIIIY